MYSNGGNSALVPTVSVFPVFVVVSSVSLPPIYWATNLSNVPFSLIFLRPSLILFKVSVSPFCTAMAYCSVEVSSCIILSVSGFLDTKFSAGFWSITTASTPPLFRATTASVPFLKRCISVLLSVITSLSSPGVHSKSPVVPSCTPIFLPFRSASFVTSLSFLTMMHWVAV